MRLTPHHQDASHGRPEYRSPDGTWRVVRTRQPGRNGNERARWEVHERSEAHAPWHCHAAFERRRDALVFLDTTAVVPGGERTAAAAAERNETPERQDEPTGSNSPRKPMRRITFITSSAASGSSAASNRSMRTRCRSTRISGGSWVLPGARVPRVSPSRLGRGSGGATLAPPAGTVAHRNAPRRTSTETGMVFKTFPLPWSVARGHYHGTAPGNRQPGTDPAAGRAPFLVVRGRAAAARVRPRLRSGRDMADAPSAPTKGEPHSLTSPSQDHYSPAP